jgi:hypothetical protein
MSHAACTPRNWVNSWLLMVESQIGLFFYHNLCFRCPNWSWKPILDIYVSISFQWYKKLFELIGFDPYNYALKIWDSIWDSNSHNGSSLGSVRVHSLTLLALSGACEVTHGLSSWPTTLQPPCLGYEPKARVTTISHLLQHHNICFTKKMNNIWPIMIRKIIYQLVALTLAIQFWDIFAKHLSPH